jgi:hypothetical protein
VTHTLAGRIFSSLGGLTGGVFGVTFSLSNTAIDLGLQALPTANWSPITKWAISYFGGIAVGSLATSLVGLPITFKAALILNLTTIGMILGGTICTLAAIVTTAAAVVAIRAYRENTTIGDAIINYGRDAMQLLQDFGLPVQEVIAAFNAMLAANDPASGLEILVQQMQPILANYLAPEQLANVFGPNGLINIQLPPQPLYDCIAFLATGNHSHIDIQH